jgi:hypothetical protein
MATYTVELRKICELYGRNEVENWFKDYSLTDYLTPIQIEQIEKFNVWSKDRLARKIVDHYYMREIGLETPELFKHYAKVSMQEIMERALPKIYSNFLEYDPLSNVDYTETYTREIEGATEGSSSSNSTNTASGYNINNNTPQKRITKQDLNTGAYASSTNQSDTNSSIEDETNAQSSSNTIERFTRHEEGDNGVIITNQRLVKEYREIIVAIDEEIINELSSLFMGIY